MDNDVQGIIVIVRLGRAGPAGNSGYRSPVAKSAAMVHHMTKQDWSAIIGDFGNVLMDVVIQRQLALLFKQEDRCSRKLFGDGAGLADGSGGHRNMMFHIGHAPGFGINNLPVAADGQFASRSLRTVSFEQSVNAPDGVRSELSESTEGKGGNQDIDR